MAEHIEECGPEDLVAFFLMIYFRRRLWTLEEILKIVDLNQVQRKLAIFLQKQVFSTSEIAVICIGKCKSIKYIYDVKMIKLFFRFEENL